MSRKKDFNHLSQDLCLSRAFFREKKKEKSIKEVNSKRKKKNIIYISYIQFQGETQLFLKIAGAEKMYQRKKNFMKKASRDNLFQYRHTYFGPDHLQVNCS